MLNKKKIYEKKQEEYETNILQLTQKLVLAERNNIEFTSHNSKLQKELDLLKEDYKNLQKEAKKILILYKEVKSAEVQDTANVSPTLPEENMKEKTPDILQFTSILCKRILQKNCIIPYRNETKNSKEYHRIAKKDFEAAMEGIAYCQKREIEENLRFLYTSGAVKSLDSKTILFRKELFDWLQEMEEEPCGK